jgi:Flavodoxin
MQREPVVGRVVVVYESMFGNTEAIARAIGDGVTGQGATVTVCDVASAPNQFDDVDVLIVGGPTHAFGISRPGTRQAARGQGAPGSADHGVREWLDRLPRPSRPLIAACFDTRIRKPFLFGSAAREMRRRLRRLGFEVVKPMSFAVADTPGPLAEGELERARRWGASLVPVLAQTSGLSR